MDSRGTGTDRESWMRREGFSVGEWSVEPRLHQIRSGEHSRRLDPRLMDVLVVLAGVPGEVVTRNELLETVWKGTFVSENSLSKAISRLRKALGDEPNDPSYIETISKSGYRLVAQVSQPESGLEVAAPELWSPAIQPGSMAGPVRATRSLLIGLLLSVVTLSVVGLVLGRGRWVEAPAPVPLVRPELTLVGSQFEPRLAPDGQHIAFAWRGGESANSWDIWVQPVGADNPRQLTDHPFHERLPAWSPDGQKVAFVRFSQAEGEGACGIFAALHLGNEPAEQIAGCVPGMRSLAWSPEGRLLAHDGLLEVPDGLTTQDNSTRALFLVNLETGDREQLTQPPAGILGDVNPRFSPDGTMLAFEREVSRSRHDVALVNVIDGETQMVTHDLWGQVRGVDWSSDGSQILFSSNRMGQYALFAVSLNGGEPARVPIHDSWVTQPSVSRAGGRLIYRTFRDSVDVWQLALDDEGQVNMNTEPIRRVPSSRSESQATWSPRADAIAFVSDRSGSAELWSSLPEGTELIRHTDLSGPMPASPVWSPDGQHIVFDAAVFGHADLWIVDRRGRAPQRLTEETSEDLNANFSRDGEGIYFASDRSGAWNIWRMPAARGPAEQVTTEGGFMARESLDGSRLLFVRLDEPGIWSMPVVGGDSVQLLPDLDLSDWGSWDVSDRGIYYVRRGPTSIGFAPFDGSAPRLVYQPPKQMPYLGRVVSLSADGRELLFSQIDHSDDEIMTVDMAGL